MKTQDIIISLLVDVVTVCETTMFDGCCCWVVFMFSCENFTVNNIFC